MTTAIRCLRRISSHRRTISHSSASFSETPENKQDRFVQNKDLDSHGEKQLGEHLLHHDVAQVQDLARKVEQRFVIQDAKIRNPTHALDALIDGFTRHLPVNVKNAVLAMRPPWTACSSGCNRRSHSQCHPCLSKAPRSEDESEVAFMKPIVEQFLPGWYIQGGKLRAWANAFYQR